MIPTDELTEWHCEQAFQEAEGYYVTFDEFAEHNCHSASLALVKSGRLGPGARVARGSLRGVAGQHSWAVIGDPYHPDWVIDVTAWSYSDLYPRVWVVPGPAPHVPQGTGSIWEHGVPECGTGPDIQLAPSRVLTSSARKFIELVASANDRAGLDARGWINLANSPVGGGWPAREIISAMLDNPTLAALVPVDIAGMLTDRNPGGLYW